MSTALPAVLRACSRTGVRIVASGALAIGLLTSAPSIDAHAATPKPAATAAKPTKPAKPRPTKVERAMRTAAAQKGDPYSYGASGPNRFDCSGLTFYSFRRAGFKGIPRTSGAQAHWAHRIKRKNMRRGDLMFFSDGGGVYHVGVFAGRRHGRALVLHAPYSGTRVRTEPVWTNAWFGGTVRDR